MSPSYISEEVMHSIKAKSIQSTRKVRDAQHIDLPIVCETDIWFSCSCAQHKCHKRILRRTLVMQHLPDEVI